MIKVGFIGLGEQGKPMAVNLAKNGFVIAIHDPALFREELDKIWYREWNKEQADAERIQLMVQGSHAGARVRRRTRTRVTGNCDGARIDRVN